MIDLAIIGGGPAALTAAIYAARAGLQTQVFEKSDFGGVLPVIPLVENYPGFMGEGKELALKMRQQAQTMSASLVYGECTRLDLSASQPASGFTLTIDDTRVTARTVLVASGSEPKKLGFDLDGIDAVSVCANDKPYMVCAAVQIPIEKDSVAGGYVGIAAVAPLPV